MRTQCIGGRACVRLLQCFDRTLRAPDGLRIVSEGNGGVGMAGDLSDKSNLDTLSLKR
jgi:hypothetical protein